MRLCIFIFFIFSQAAFANLDTRKLSTAPREIYGDQDNIGLRIANGGAGETGILKFLAEDFLQKTGKNYGIAWYRDITINALKHLKNGTVDIALVYEKSQGDAAQEEGWATNYAVIFNDHFLIVGPKENPVKIDKFDSVTIAFSKISEFGKVTNQPIFLSRADESGTNSKEKSIWKAIGLEPWNQSSKWYLKDPTFSKEALLYADKEMLYSITNWGTWLPTKNDLENSTIYLRGGKALLNPCFALLGKNPSKDALEFLEYLESPRAQKIIAEFGKEEYGQPLFTEAAQQDFK
jgi:ABC-type tungstate transport system permease subunit